MCVCVCVCVRVWGRGGLRACKSDLRHPCNLLLSVLRRYFRQSEFNYSHCLWLCTSL